MSILVILIIFILINYYNAADDMPFGGRINAVLRLLIGKRNSEAQSI